MKKPPGGKQSDLEAALWLQLRLSGNRAGFEQEYRFHPTRKWRFDFAHPERMIGIEVEGLSRGKSRHTTFEGYRRDCEKYNEAAIMGWCVLRFTDREITKGTALRTIERCLHGQLARGAG